MCDQTTNTAIDAGLARRGLSRRSFAAMGAASAIAACAPMEGSGASLTGLIEGTVSVPTPDGMADAFFVHPAQGKHPGVIMWPDVAGLREAYKVMGRKLASAGYSVLVVNHYYRGGAAPFVETIAEFFDPAGREKLGPLIQGVNAQTNISDAKAFVAWLDQQDVVDSNRKIGSQGYCMTGSYAMRTAAASDRVGAACSFHGGGLVGDGPDSPHLVFGKTQAAFLIAIAQNDDANSPEDKNVLRQAAAAAGSRAEIEVYAADHGWCTVDSPSYDQPEADRAWQRMLGFYATL